MTPVSNIVTSVQALLNDQIGQVFTFAVQKPYINIAIRELREVMEANNVSMTNAVETGILIPAGTTEINPVNMPADLIEIQQLLERVQGSGTDYIAMRRMEFLPSIVTQIAYLVFWTYQDQKVKFIGATSDIELKMNYVADRMPLINNEVDRIALINCDSFLQYRTAGLCAQFIGENKERADDLNSYAVLALDRFLLVNVKGKQSIFVRRRPFNASLKNSTLW